MTPIAWALLGIVWGMLASILMIKWFKFNKTEKLPLDEGFIAFMCWILLPVTVVVVIIKQTFLEDWK